MEYSEKALPMGPHRKKGTKVEITGMTPSGSEAYKGQRGEVVGHGKGRTSSAMVPYVKEHHVRLEDGKKIRMYGSDIRPLKEHELSHWKQD